MIRLNLKEQMAMEFRFLGLMYPEIATRIDVPLTTVRGWFETKGKLYSAYNAYQEEMIKVRNEATKKRLYLQDEEIYTIATNTARVFSQQSLSRRKVPLRNKVTGEIVYDEKGNPLMVDYRPVIKFGDVKKAVELQRLLRGLPTSYEKSEMIQTTIEEDKIIKELGLTEEDFKDERRTETAKRIADHLASK